jgi:prepilin-type N-terminal cleavage/methylation domain-containing protein
MRRGLTLLELLVVVAIITLLVGLLLPVVQMVRSRGYKTTCISNLRQIGAALQMYLQDYAALPDTHRLTYPYIRNTQVYLCPADPLAPEPGAGGYEAWLFAQRRYNLSFGSSYFYLPTVTVDPLGYRSTTHLYNRLAQADSNHGVLVCALHAQCDRADLTRSTYAVYSCFDHILRLRLDGSVQWVAVPMRWFICRDDGAWTGSRDHWRLFTDVPCPPDICNDTGC